MRRLVFICSRHVLTRELLVIRAFRGKEDTLGRIDGVDCRSDTPCSTGFDSRTLQPRRPTHVAKSAKMCYARLRIRPAVHIEAHEASQQCDASFFCMSRAKICALVICVFRGMEDTLGRFDGVDYRSDTPSGSGFDSRALQP